MSSEPRPASVSLVVVLTWISAIVAVLQGLGFLFKFKPLIESSGVDGALVTFTGAAWLVVGLVLAFAASKLGSGSNLMRILVTLVMILRIVAGGFELANGGLAARTTAALTIAFAGATLALLWNSKASAFFSKK